MPKTQLLINPLVCDKLSIIKKKGWSKNSYERRAYESVNNRTLS